MRSQTFGGISRRSLLVVPLLGLATALFVLAFSRASEVDVWLSWFLIGIAVGWLMNRWWTLALSLLPVTLAWLVMFLTRPPTAPLSAPEFGWFGLVMFIFFWGVVPGLGGMAVGITVRRARTHQRF